MPVGVQCPISSSLGEFLSYWDWLWCPGLLPVLVSIALPFAFHTWCFPIALICYWISIVFFSLRPTYRHPFGRPFTYSLLGEFPVLGLALVPDVVVPEADNGAQGAEDLIQISALAVVQSRTLASRLPRTSPFSRLLRHAGCYSRTILTPNLQGCLKL